MEQFKEILYTNLSFGAFFLLDKLMTDEVISYNADDKIGLLMKELERKGYIDESSSPTHYGVTLWKSIKSKEKGVGALIKGEKKKERKRNEDSFDDWWAIFPPHDGFENFPKSRTLRVDKEKCKELFTKMITSQEYTAYQIVEATKIDVETRKSTSRREKKNKLTFLQNSATYLRQKSFDGMIGEISKQSNDSQEVGGITDI